MGFSMGMSGRSEGFSDDLGSRTGFDMNAFANPPVENGMFITTNSPVEKYCAVGDPVIIEWKGARYRTVMRGAKMEVVATIFTALKPRLQIIPETSFFLTDMPRNYSAAGFEFNSPLTVRFLRDGKVYAFKTTLTRVHNQPPVMVLKYPEKVEYHNMRSDERVGVVFPVRIIENGGQVNKMGAVLDLSASGAKVGLDELGDIRVGEEIELSFTLPNGAAVSDLAVAVRSISEENGKYFLGTSFLGYVPAVTGFCRECSDCLE